MRARFTALRLIIGLVVALVVTIVVLNRIPWNKYIVLPDGAHPVAPLVEVQGARKPKDTGTLYFVDVFVRQASQLDRLARWLHVSQWLHPHATYLPAKVVVPPGSSDNAVNQANLREMATSQQIAAAVAERQLHLPVVMHPFGVLVDNVYDNVPAAAKVDPADVIVAADGKPTITVAALQAALTPVKPGQIVTLTIRRGSQTVTERVKTFADPAHPSRAFIGVLVEQGAKITLPRKVKIDANGVGGPSAGLAFTLQVMEQLGANVTHGYKVAATGAISLDGAVTAIGGVEQKTWGVRAAGAQVFLVPVDGGNAKTAEKYAGPNLKIIPVTSIGQALRALAALPKLK
ncbi:MAG TPA: PDZ domain-containing protein [Gaiellaceae bacterium]|nr:PDZ domain-containing protein [Gaiellaceae bacterium]